MNQPWEKHGKDHGKEIFVKWSMNPMRFLDKKRGFPWTGRRFWKSRPKRSLAG